MSLPHTSVLTTPTSLTNSQNIIHRSLPPTKILGVKKAKEPGKLTLHEPLIIFPYGVLSTIERLGMVDLCIKTLKKQAQPSNFISRPQRQNSDLVTAKRKVFYIFKLNHNNYFNGWTC